MVLPDSHGAEYTLPDVWRLTSEYLSSSLRDHYTTTMNKTNDAEKIVKYVSHRPEGGSI